MFFFTNNCFGVEENGVQFRFTATRFQSLDSQRNTAILDVIARLLMSARIQMLQMIQSSLHNLNSFLVFKKERND